MADTGPEATTVARFAEILASLGDESSFTTRLCEAGRRLLGGDGVAMAMGVLGDDHVVMHASDDLAARLDDLEEVVGEGPAHDAVRSGTVVTGGFGATADHRWNLLREHVEDLGFAGTLIAIPLLTDGSDVGVLTVHRARESEWDLAAAGIVGATVATAVVAHSDDPAEALAEAWPPRAQVHQATGMIVAQVRVPPDDALALLRAQAFARGVPLLEVARDIIERRIDFRDFQIEGD